MNQIVHMNQMPAQLINQGFKIDVNWKQNESNILREDERIAGHQIKVCCEYEWKFSRQHPKTDRFRSRKKNFEKIFRKKKNTAHKWPTVRLVMEY